jgi:hypothetical protein
MACADSNATILSLLTTFGFRFFSHSFLEHENLTLWFFVLKSFAALAPAA